mmetsp:Transcript_27610/g.65551  ORF Transcript_27610/g.65551 Transcript_27610/m.65551 type:complete len:341 (+) Transcript_27610:523-1545(+)
MAAAGRAHVAIELDLEREDLDRVDGRGGSGHVLVEQHAHSALAVRGRHAGLIPRELQLHVEDADRVLGHAEAVRHHLLRRHQLVVEADAAQPRRLLLQRVLLRRRRLEQLEPRRRRWRHLGAAPSVKVLLERDQRKEVHALRQMEPRRAPRGRRRPLEGRVDPERTPEAPVQAVLLGDGFRVVDAQIARVGAVAEHRRHVNRLRRGGGVQPVQIGVHRGGVAERGIHRRPPNLNRRHLGPHHRYRHAGADLAARDAHLVDQSVGVGARGVEGADGEQVRGRLQHRDALPALHAELERAVELVAVRVEAVGIGVVVGRLGEERAHATVHRLRIRSGRALRV